MFLRGIFLRATAILSALLLVFQGNYPVLAQSFPMHVQLTDLSADYSPPALKGLYFNPNKPQDFEFIIDPGTKKQITRQEALRLVNYFLAGLTLPAKNLWVNLSPYEEDRIIPSSTAATELGEGLLRQDYLLKQLAASLTYPETEVGKKYWEEIQGRGGSRTAQTTERPPTPSLAKRGSEQSFNKIWIVPDKAAVEEENNVVMISEATLKVMMEKDYLAAQQNNVGARHALPAITGGACPSPTDAFKTHILPLIEKDVNQGKNFVQLRQIYSSLILAMWFKKNFAARLYKNYADKEKITGIDLADKMAKEKIYTRYLEAFKQGAYNYVKKEITGTGTGSPTRGSVYVPGTKMKRQYFSGGAAFGSLGHQLKIRLKIKTAVSSLTGFISVAAALIACDNNNAKSIDAAVDAESHSDTVTVVDNDSAVSLPISFDGGPATATNTATGTGTGTGGHTPQNTLYYPDGTIMFGSKEPAVAYNPPDYNYTGLYDVADGGQGDAQDILDRGIKVVKIYLPGTLGLQNAGVNKTPKQIMQDIAQIGQKLSAKGLKFTFVFSPYFFLGNTISPDALQGYIQDFKDILSGYDWVTAIQLGNEENLQVKAGALLGADGKPLDLAAYYKLYDEIAKSLKEAVPNKPVMLGMAATVHIPADVRDLNANLALIRGMSNIDAIALNLTNGSSVSMYNALLEYIHNQLGRPIIGSEIGMPRYVAQGYSSQAGSVYDPAKAQAKIDQDISRMILAQCDTTGNAAGVFLFAYFQNSVDSAGGQYYDLSPFFKATVGNFVTAPSGYVKPQPGSWDEASFWLAADVPEDNRDYFSGYLTYYDSLADPSQVNNLKKFASAAAYYLLLSQMADTDLTGFSNTFDRLAKYESADVDSALGWSPYEDAVGITMIAADIATGSRLDTFNKTLSDHPGNIGNDARAKLKTLKFSEDMEGGSVEVTENKDDGMALGPLQLRRAKTIVPDRMIKRLINKLENAGHKAILTPIVSLPGEANQVYTYSRLYRDLLAFNSPADRVLMLHNDLSALSEELLAIVLWHENGHVLMDNGRLTIERTGSDNAELIVNGKILELKRNDAKAFVAKAYEMYKGNDIQRGNHYLLRALAREIFGESDMKLSIAIKELKAKHGLPGLNDAAPAHTGGVNLTEDWLKVKATKREGGLSDSSQASSADFTGWRAVIKHLEPVNKESIARLIQQPSYR